MHVNKCMVFPQMHVTNIDKKKRHVSRLRQKIGSQGSKYCVVKCPVMRMKPLNVWLLVLDCQRCQCVWGKDVTNWFNVSVTLL